MTAISNHVVPVPVPRHFTVVAAGAQTATTNWLVHLEDTHLDALTLVFNLTALTGTTPSVTFQVQGWDPVAGATYELGSGSGITTGSLTTAVQKVVRIQPAMPNGALTAQDMVPPQVLVTATIGGSASPTATFSIAGLMGR